MKKKVPKFKNEDEERKFWATHDSTAYVDWRKAKREVLPELKPSIKTISLRLPESMFEELKLLANKRDVPYQSLLKVFLGERIREELDRIKKLEGKGVFTLEVRCTNEDILRYDCTVEKPDRDGHVHLRLSAFDQHVNVPQRNVKLDWDSERNREKFIVENVSRDKFPKASREAHYILS